MARNPSNNYKLRKNLKQFPTLMNASLLPELIQPDLSAVVGSNECCDGQNTKDVQKELKKETEELRSSTKSRKASHVCPRCNSD